MKKIFIAFASLLLICGCTKKQDTNCVNIIGKPDIQVQEGRFTPEVMWALGKMGEKTVSPDGKQIAYRHVLQYGREQGQRRDIPHPLGGR